ncbi:MAG: LamG domain-containing protein [Candidatus Hydrogenedentes bacterium]|nr:LamG domain-containing protein [Candidatus Hydrogenedentota bacterium]
MNYCYKTLAPWLLRTFLPLAGALAAGEANLDAGLIAHYPLVTDAKDATGHGHDGAAHEMTFEAGRGAKFNGHGAYIEVPDAVDLDFGVNDFSIATWISTSEQTTDALGDIAGKFDPASRTGLNFCLQHAFGIASSQANDRNLLFGVDAGTEPSVWTDRGRPGNATMVFALCVWEGNLYAGTFELEKEGRGHVYRLEGDAWVDCGAPAESNAITSLVVHEGKLYAASSHYRSGGSALPDSENVTPGGHVYRFEGDQKWRDMGGIGEGEAIGGMVSFQSYLFASSLYAPAGLWRMKWGGGWDNMGNPGGRIVALTVRDGAIYGSGYDENWGGVYRWDPEAKWADCGTPPGTTQTYSFATHYGNMYVGTWPSGKVFRYDGNKAWEDQGQLGEEKEVMGTLVYNGKLYAGTLPLAKVYRFDGPSAWHDTGQLDTTPDVKYRRAWTMAVYDGQLFCGTLPSGKVYSMRAGYAATHDTALDDGWRHVAAVRRGTNLELWVDGQKVDEQSIGKQALDISNEVPFTIGFGANDYFNGFMNNFRIYNRALAEAELTELSDYTKQGQGIPLDFSMKYSLDPAKQELTEGRFWKISDFLGTGEVRVEGDQVYLGEGNDMTGVVWRGPLVTMNYEITLQAQRVSGGDFFCGLTFPYGEKPCALICGGWGGTLVGISSLDYQDAYNNETARTKFFENARWYNIRLRITEGRMQAWIDEEQFVDVEVGNREVGIRWEVERSRPLGIATWRTSGAIRNVVLRAIDPARTGG